MKRGMHIRAMRQSDYEAAAALWRRTEGMGLGEADSEENIARFLQRNPGLSFVCEQSGRIVGTVMCGHDGRRGYLYHAAVDAALRGGGIGRALVSRALSALEEAGIEKCHLFVFAENEEGQAFWNATGWQKRGDIAVFSKNTEDGQEAGDGGRR